jgi:ParB/RepB/Spo0J family partition protein
MATTVPTTQAGTIAVALEKIYVPANVRELDLEHVDALAGSIALQGLLVPVLIAAAEGEIAEQGFEYELVAGFHRYAAVAKLQHGAVDAVIRDRDDQAEGAELAAARATENIARKQLSPYEEALAVKAMLDRDFTEDGAAQALGWPKVRVTARVRLLELPETAQKLVGEGVVPLSCVETLRTVGRVSPGLLGEIIDVIADGDDWLVNRLHNDLGAVISHVLRESESKTFAAFLTYLNGYEVQALKLGKKAAAQLEEMIALHKQINRYSYSGPQIRFGELEIDQARAAGVLIEAGGAPVIVDRPLYRELAKQLLKRTVEELREHAAHVAEERKASKRPGSGSEDGVAVVDRAAELKREHGRQMRQLAAQAHGVNVDLGWALRNQLSVIDPADVNIARFFVHAALGGDSSTAFGKRGEQVMRLAMSGIRLVVEEFRTDVTEIKKDGTRGALRIDYGDPHKPEDAIAWMWKFIDRARTAGELYGRALVVIAAEQYASRLVLSASQQQHPLSWASHDGKAIKALEKLAGPHLPAALKQLEKAVSKAKADYDKQLKAVEPAQRATAAQHNRQPPAADAPAGGAEAAGVDVDGVELGELEIEEADERDTEAA